MAASHTLKDHQIAIVGAGNIGRALIGGLLKGHDIDPANIRASRRSESALANLGEQFPGIRTTTDNQEAVRGATIIVLAVKPQVVLEIISEIKRVVTENTLVISVLAGITTDTLHSKFELNLPVVRTMPNTPALVDEGATAMCKGTHANDSNLEVARAVFEAVGTVEVVPEYLMDAITGLSGSGPAYIYMIIEALTDAGVKQGIPRTTAARLAAQTVFGAAKLVIDTQKHPAILRDEVTTPGGTTISAIAELESHGLRTMLINAVATATARSKELSGVE
ncbi:MAG: pyrroline-5-carboxylate reductase [Rhodothermaceae bacterium]|nr:pyrroline-5-carboxylate reductase [Rhodothermaceae bacterium]